MTGPLSRCLPGFHATSTAARGLMLAVLALLVAGCGTAPRVRPISARPVVVAGAVGAADAAGFQIEIELENVGDVDIPLERFDYAFTVEGVGRFEGRWVAFLTLPPRSTRTTTIPASMPLPPGLADEIDFTRPIAWRLEGGLRYQAPGLLGRILFDAGIRRPTEGFEGSGTFQLAPPADPEPDDGNSSPDPTPDGA